MQKLTARRSMITCLIIVLLAAAALAGVDGWGRRARVLGATGSLQRGAIVRKLVNEPNEAYQIWKGSGYRGRTVIFVADRWESFDPGELLPQQMFRAYPLELYNTARLLEEEHLNGITFLYVASMNRIIRRIVAVVPESEVERMRKLAPSVKDSQAGSKGVFLSRQGFPRWYTTGANFTGTGEPALLYVGASYFRNAQPEELYGQLSRAGLQTDCVILCREAGKSGVTAKESAKLDSFARLLGMTVPPAGGAGELLRPQAPGHGGAGL
jgi:hypothetical protein